MSQQILKFLTSSLGSGYASTYGEIVGCITAAVVLVVSYRIYSTITVPRDLRHLPYVPFSKIGAAIFRNETEDIISKKLFLPEYRKQGLVVLWRQGLWQVSIANPEYAKKLLMRLETFPKKEMFVGEADSGLLARFLGNSNIIFQNGDHWKRHRKIANPAFHRSMPVKLFGTLTQKLFKSFEANGNHIDVPDYMQRFTLDAIGKAGFGFDFNSIEDAKNSWVILYNDVMKAISNPLYLLFPVLEGYFLWMLPKRNESHRKMDKLNKLFTEVIQNKKRVIQQDGYEPIGDEDNEKDLLTLMIEANETEKLGGLSDQELRDNLAIFFIAGHDTTANAISAAIYFLATDKVVQQKAREEAISVLGDAPEDVLPSIEQTKEFKYINQIMKETMRIAPPAPNMSPRKTATDIDLGSYHIPKGSTIGVDIYAIHHNPDNWMDPERFDPERFAEGGESEARMGNVNGAGYFWIPFSNGGRQCIGMNFSLVEQRVMLSMLLRKYEWSLPADSIHKDGLKFDPKSMLVLTPRELIVDFHPRY